VVNKSVKPEGERRSFSATIVQVAVVVAWWWKSRGGGSGGYGGGGGSGAVMVVETEEDTNSNLLYIKKPFKSRWFFLLELVSSLSLELFVSISLTFEQIGSGFISNHISCSSAV
jgi:hypothetical protein